MAKGLFITATGTDAGKTYITALIVKALREKGLNAGYYKAALSGADSIPESDAGYVKKTAGIDAPDETLASYIYKTAVSPHLAAKIEGNPVDMDVVKVAYKKSCSMFDYVTVEGSGGIVCPIRYDDTAKIFLEDIIKTLDLPCLVIADAGLGTINAVVTTVEYMRSRKLEVCGVVLNNWSETVMEQDNRKMIEDMTGLPVCAVVERNSSTIDISQIEKFYR
ncbi:MAG: dethiobiotin synthase [Porcipelethomonas sp.]